MQWYNLVLVGGLELYSGWKLLFPQFNFDLCGFGEMSEGGGREGGLGRGGERQLQINL